MYLIEKSTDDAQQARKRDFKNLLGLTVNLLMTRGAATQFIADEQRSGLLTPVYMFDLQHQKILYLGASLFHQLLRPNFNEGFEHFLHVMIAEAGTPPHLRNRLVFIERHFYLLPEF
jgi:hypothetical protein